MSVGVITVKTIAITDCRVDGVKSAKVVGANSQRNNHSKII